MRNAVKAPQKAATRKREATLNLYHKNTRRVQRGQSPLCGTLSKFILPKLKKCFSKTKFYVLVKQINRKTIKEAGARSALASLGAKRPWRFGRAAPFLMVARRFLVDLVVKNRVVRVAEHPPYRGVRSGGRDRLVATNLNYKQRHPNCARHSARTERQR